MSEQTESSRLLLPRSTRKLELNGLLRAISPKLPARVAIAGGPRAGKSHLAESLRSGNRIVRGTDELIGLEWSASSRVASLWFDYPGEWICEGVMIPRALRKWLARSTGSPADLVVWINQPVVARNRGQHVMALGCETVWRQIKPELERRGARILEA